jgi:hypothetical protein
MERSVPDSREQVSLNGEWPEGGTVPNYFGETFDARTFRREVQVPAAWVGKRVAIEFRQVNYIADVYVDGRHVANHVGGWIPFSVDVTPHVEAGRSFALEVSVKTSDCEPYVDSDGHALWPVGLYPDHKRSSGIVDDVWLRAYGTVAIEDAFIRTSYRDKAIAVDYALTNHDDVERTVSVVGEVAQAEDGAPVKRLASEPAAIPPGATVTIAASAPWPDPMLWTPDTPALYHLTSRVTDGEEVVDRETRRFGFREIWIEGNQFILNGVRTNLWGTSIARGESGRQPYLTPAGWPAHLAMMKDELNIRILRWHQHPAADYLLEVADEMGLFIIDESALYARPIYAADHSALLPNVRAWIGDWIRAHRNHPSIIMWSAENECGWMHGSLMRGAPISDADLLSLGDAIREQDPTRPVTYDGDGDVGDAVVNWHYPEGFEALPRRESERSGPVGAPGSIYGWAEMGLELSPAGLPDWTEGVGYGPTLYPDKPTGLGEFLACGWVEELKPDVFWWHGTWCRGMRYTDYTDIRPYTLGWTYGDEQPEAKRNLANSFAPVALFDKEYDDLGIEPLMSGECPQVEEGETLQRTLVLYNDEWADTSVTVEVEVRSGGTVHASGRKAVELALGEHTDIPCSFQVPNVGDAEMEMVLRTYKGGVKKFEEAKPFSVRATGRGGPGAEGVTIGEPTGPR